MFTGIITNIATISDLQKNYQEDLLITLKLPVLRLRRDLEIGCSIACDGVCLTLISKSLKDSDFLLNFQASKETINKTNIKNWILAQKINIEFALKIGDELGGHLVSGHVDDIAKLETIEPSDQSRIFTFSFHPNFRKFICQKGSITLNGTSLTVNEVFENKFTVNIIDHTFNNTNFSALRIGDSVNLEIDQIARYLDNLKQFS